jgi:hypothetical protein
MNKFIKKVLPKPLPKKKVVLVVKKKPIVDAMKQRDIKRDRKGLA